MSTYDDASLIYYPSGYKAGKAYSLKPTDGSGDLTFTRASTATRVNSAGLIESVATGVPRIDYTGGGCGSLLLEPQRTNQFLNSQNAENLSIKSGASVVSNTTTSPDGTINADSIIESSASGLHYCGGSGFAASQNSFSIFLKANTRNWAYVTTYDGAADRGAYFDLSNGVIGTIDSGVTAKIENYGDGWYRCSVTSTTVSVYSATVQLAIGNLQRVYLGNGTSGIYVWGFQLEPSAAYPTSYIPTTTTAVTRVSDIAGKSGISSLIGQTEGVVFYDFIWQTTGQANQSSSVNSGSYYNSISFGHYGGALRLEIYYNGTPISLGSQVLITGQRYKIAFAYKSGDSATYVNGVQLSTSSTSFAFASALNNLFLTYNGENFGDKVNTYMLFKTRLSNAELATLTTI